jgi:hypothetical protein
MYRTGHIDTDTSDITYEGMSEKLQDPTNFVASPVAAPYSATYDSQSQEWYYGDWRIVTAGDYCIVAYDEDLVRQWTFYTTQRVVSTPAICILAGSRSPSTNEIEGPRAAIVMTRGISGVANPIIHVLDLKTGEEILRTTMPDDPNLQGTPPDHQWFTSLASPLCHSEWVDSQHGRVQIFINLLQERVWDVGGSEKHAAFCLIEMEYDTGSGEWAWVMDGSNNVQCRFLYYDDQQQGATHSSPILMDNGYIAFCSFEGMMCIANKDDFWDDTPDLHYVDMEHEVMYATIAEVPTILDEYHDDCHYFAVAYDAISSSPGAGTAGVNLVRMQRTSIPNPYDVDITDTLELDDAYRLSSPSMLTRTDVTRTVGETEYDFGDELFPDAIFVTSINGAPQATRVYAISTTVEDYYGDLRIVFSDSQSDDILVTTSPNHVLPSSFICSDSQVYLGIGPKMYMGDISFNGDQVSLTNFAPFKNVGGGDSFSARPMLLEQTLTSSQGGSENCQELSLYNLATNGVIYKWDTDDTTNEPTNTIEWFSFQSMRRIHDLSHHQTSLDAYVNDRHPVVVREDVDDPDSSAPIEGPRKGLISSPVVALIGRNPVRPGDPDHIIIQAKYNRVYGLNEDLTIRWLYVADQIVKGTPVVFKIEDAAWEEIFHHYAVFIVTYGEDWWRSDWGYVQTENDRPWEILLDPVDGRLMDSKQVFHDGIAPNLLGGAGPAPDENWFYVQSSPLHYESTVQRDHQQVTLHRLFFTVQYIYAIYPSTLGAEHIFCRLTVEKVNGEWKFIDDNMGFDPSYEKWREYGIPHYYDNKPCYSSPTWTVVDKPGIGNNEPGMIAVGNNDGNVYFFNWNSFWLQPGDLRDFYAVDISPAVVLYSTAAYSEKEQSLFIGVDEYALNPAGYFTTALVQIDLTWGAFGQPWPWVNAQIVDKEELTYRYISSPCILPINDPGSPEIHGTTEYVFVLTTDMADPEEVQHGGNVGMDSEVHMVDASAPAALTLVDSIYEFSGPAVFDGIPSSVICTNEQIYVGIGMGMFIGDIGNDQIDNWMMFFAAPDGTFCASPAIFLFTDNGVGLFRMVNLCTNGRLYKWME